MRFFLSRIFSVALLILIMCPSIRAGGLWLYEEGTPDLGTAGAGRAGFSGGT